MKNRINELLYEVKRRPLCFFCLFTCLVITFLVKTGLAYVSRPVYLPGCDNIFEQSGIQEGDRILLLGKIKNLGKREIGGRETVLATVSRVREKNNSNITSGNSQIYAYFSPEEQLKIGQYIEFEGELSYFDRASNPGEFDAYEYYRNISVLYAVYNCRISRAGKDYAHIGNKLYEIRLKGEDILQKKLGTEDAAIMKAMIFGNKSEISEDVKEQFQKNGIAHILAISGLHISLIAMGIYKLLGLLGISVKLRVLLSETVLILYGYMVGFPISAVRAITMFSIYLCAKLILRTYDLMTALSVSMAVVSLLWPGRIFDAGTQLSFFAVAGIGLFMARFEKNVVKPPGWMSPALVSFFVFAATLPVLLNTYYEVALYSVLLNLVIIPLMSILMFSGIGLVMLGGLTALMSSALKGIGYPGDRMLTVIVSGILWLYKGTCAFLTEKGMGRFNVGCPKWWQTALFFLLLFVATGAAKGMGQGNEKVNNLNGKDKVNVSSGNGKMCDVLGKWNGTLISFLRFTVIMIIAFCILFAKTDRGMKVWMLDVGQGDCMIIRSDSGKYYVIDGGSTSKKNVGERIIIPALKYYGVNEIEAVFITHPDEDHMNGIMELLDNQAKERLRVKKVYVFEGFLQDEKMDEKIDEISKIAKAGGTKVEGLKSGNGLSDGRLDIRVLYPERGHETTDLNNASLVMKVTYGEFCMLTTGDVEAKGEHEIASLMDDATEKRATSEKGSYDILKVAHHGSSSSSSEELLDNIRPKVALISVGENNRYGHPHKEVLERLAASNAMIIRTDESGAICAKIGKDGSVVQFTTFRKNDIMK